MGGINTPQRDFSKFYYLLNFKHTCIQICSHSYKNNKRGFLTCLLNILMLMMLKIKQKAIVNKLNVIQIYLFLMTIIYKQYANKFIKNVWKFTSFFTLIFLLLECFSIILISEQLNNSYQNIIIIKNLEI